jgi:D-glycero-D-manno-heptose 1,7-bisphosphate phosphatase
MTQNLLMWKPENYLCTKKQVVIFDRDDTLIEDAGQHSDKKRLIWKVGALEAIMMIADSGFEVGIASNQSAISRGIFSIQNAQDFTCEMNQQCLNATGVEFAAVAICPHSHFTQCGCRKPAPGLLVAVTQTTGCKISVLFGDKDSDVQTAENYGIIGIKVHQNGVLPKVKEWLKLIVNS